MGPNTRKIIISEDVTGAWLQKTIYLYDCAVGSSPANFVSSSAGFHLILSAWQIMLH
jgi:hypothetical protein